MRKESGDKNEKRKYNREGNRHRLRTVCRTGRGKKSMWVGQQLAEGLDFYGFIKSLILGGMILELYTGLLGYVGAKTGLSMDLLAKRAFGEKGSYLSSAMISFTQIGWFIRIRWNCDTELCEICQRCEVRNDRNSCSVLYRKFHDVLLRSDCIYLHWQK